MARSSDWNLGKGAWTLLDLVTVSCSAALIPLYWSPMSETLRAVSTERLFFYALFYGFAFLVAGEMLGFHESSTHRSWRFRVAIGVLAAVGACLALLSTASRLEVVAGRDAGAADHLPAGGWLAWCSEYPLTILIGMGLTYSSEWRSLVLIEVLAFPG